MKPNSTSTRDFVLRRGALLLALAVTSAPIASAAEEKPDEKPVAVATFSDAECETAHKLLQEGKAAEVVAMLEAHPAVKARQRRAELPYALALLRTGREREATQIAWRYKRTTENDVEALKLVGYVLLAAKEYDQARSFFKLAQHYAKNDLETEFNMARCTAFRRLDDASQQALAAFEAKKSALPSGMFDEALGTLAVRRAEANIAKFVYDDTTLELLRKATQFLPNDPAVFNMLSGVLIQREDYPGAEEVLGAMERKFDNRMELVQCQRALIQEKKGNLDQAMRLAGDAITLSRRKLVPALLIFARTAFKLEKYDEARRPLDDVINQAPRDVEARLLMSDYLFVRIRQIDDARALAATPGATEANPEQPATDLRLRNEFMEQIEKHLQLAIGTEPMDPAPFERLVKLYEMWGAKKVTELELCKKDLDTRLRVQASLKKKAKSPP